MANLAAPQGVEPASHGFGDRRSPGGVAVKAKNPAISDEVPTPPLMGKLVCSERNPIDGVKRTGGWEKLEMINKYAHLSGEYLSKFSGIVTFLAQDTGSTNDAVRLHIVI